MLQHKSNLRFRRSAFVRISQGSSSRGDLPRGCLARQDQGFPTLILLACVVLTWTSGCARHWCVPVVCLDSDEAIIRAQSPEEVDPAFQPTPQSAQAPLPWDQPLTEAMPIGREPRLEAAPARAEEVLNPENRPLYKASPLGMPEPEMERPAPNEPLADVRFEGNATIPVAAMSRYIKTRPGRPVTVDQVRDDVRALYNTKWFFSIEPVYRREAEGLILIYKVTERPILQQVEYRGNKKYKDHVLAGITGLKPMHAYSVATNREAARRIKEYYVEKGYLFAEVNLAEGAHPEDRSVVFEIEEGPKVQVASIRFVGNQDVSSEVLKLRLSTKKRILWTIGGQYDPTNVPEDVAAIKEYYHNIGYFDMTVNDQVEFSSDRSSVTVTFHISEGPRYRIRDVKIEGNQIYSLEQLTKDFNTKSGDFYSVRNLNKDVQSVQQKYGELGRLFAKVNASTVFTQDPGIVDLVLNIDEDRVYKIGMVNVHIRGPHSHTKETVALNQMLFAPGELADPEKIRRTRARFAGSSIWEGGGPTAPEIKMQPVADPTYLARNSTPDPAVVRGSDGYFGGEKPLNLDTLNLPDSVKRAVQGTEFMPTTLREERTPSPQANASAPVPGAGHTLKTSRKAVSPPAHLPGPARTESSGSEQSRYFREERLPRASVQEPVSEPLLYQPIDLNTTRVFHEPEDLYLPVIVDQTADSPVIRGQNFDNYTRPPNLMYGETPQGDLLGPQLPSPAIPPGYVDLDVYLSEARTGRFMVGAGVNSDSGVVGNIVLEEQNFDITRFPTSFRDIADGYAFRGGGQQFRLEATPGSQVSRYLVNWTDPYFLNTDYSLGVSGFYYQRFFRDWQEERAGGRINVGKLLTRELSTNLALRLENVDISRPRLAPGLAPSVDEMLGSSFLGTGRFTLGYDTRDSAMMATEGFNINGSVEQAFAEYDFTKLEMQASHYYTVYQRPDGAGKHVMSLRGNLGWTTDDTPAFERFYAGGFQTFRGFEFRSVSPLEPGDIGTNGAAVGGMFQLLGTAEYSLPIMANEAVRIVAFSDFGTVEENVKLKNFRVSVGAGLRITIPQMGPVPIALDWAFPVVKEDNDIRQIFSFYIGLTR